MKDTHYFAHIRGIDYGLFTTPTSAASPHEAVSALGIFSIELGYAYRSKAFHDAKGKVFSHLEQHARSPNPQIANNAREALQKLAIMLG